LFLSPTSAPDHRPSPNSILTSPRYLSHRDTVTISSTPHTPARAHIHTYRHTHTHTHTSDAHTHTHIGTACTPTHYSVYLPHPLRLTPLSVGYPRTAPNGLHMREMAASFLRLPCTYILRYSLATHTISLSLSLPGPSQGLGERQATPSTPPCYGHRDRRRRPPSLGCCRNSTLTP
ncbi:hypothetical protein CABS01_14775, partial [Colletotrichum abscissum]|uniref:uncharacterized protein n=1 Tax=Colletotrichum abscissum TaxID=1671311 RepID=UPI0027D5A7FB